MNNSQTAAGDRGLPGRAAVVTGGSRGIGRAIVERLLVGGCRVAFSSRNAAEGQAAAAELATIHSPDVVRYVQGDASLVDDVDRLIAVAVEVFGRLDVVVANAGVDRGAPLVDMTDDDWDQVINVDLRGTFLAFRAGARWLIGQGEGGRLIALASTNAFWVEANLASYNVAKAGVVALTRTAAIELAPHGITVNAVGPGLIDTPLTAPTINHPEVGEWYRRQIPMGRFGSPADVAGAVAFLVSEDAAWITGHHLVIDGGQTAGMDLPLAAITAHP